MERPPLTDKPFATAAMDLTERGLIVLPTGKDSGKTPLVGFWDRKKASKTISSWQRKFATANIGVAVGASGFVVVDIDHAEGDPVELGFKWFGPTPLVTQTPRGGVHLWYKKVGRVRSTPFELPGLKGDIKADGGQVIVPPSYNPNTRCSYRFLTGSWDDLNQLPEFRGPRPVGAGPDQPHERQRKATRGLPNAPDCPSGKIPEGSRNNSLLKLGLAPADQAQTVDELDAELRRLNESLMSPPLPEAEIVSICKSLWRYKEQGTLWLSGQGGGVTLSATELSLLKLPRGHEALALWVVLKRSHSVRQGPFPISDEAMAKYKIIATWGPKIYARARKRLLREGWIDEISPSRKDSNGRWTAAQYEFGTPSAKSADNKTYSLSAPPTALTLSTGPRTAAAWSRTMPQPEGNADKPEADSAESSCTADHRDDAYASALRLGPRVAAEAAGWARLHTMLGRQAVS